MLPAIEDEVARRAARSVDGHELPRAGAGMKKNGSFQFQRLPLGLEGRQSRSRSYVSSAVDAANQINSRKPSATAFRGQGNALGRFVLSGNCASGHHADGEPPGRAGEVFRIPAQRASSRQR